ncbi:MAG: hypothetical protein M3Z04_03625 [Chloroflexota bacterium]|nr:hypothetical protein [Chloroflexota bacterium]
MTKARREQIERVGVLVALLICVTDIASYFVLGHLIDWLLWLLVVPVAVFMLFMGLKGTIYMLTSVGITMPLWGLVGWLMYGGPN